MKLKFCKERDVDAKFKKFLIYKAKLMEKLTNLKITGKKIEVMKMVDVFI